MMALCMNLEQVPALDMVLPLMLSTCLRLISATEKCMSRGMLMGRFQVALGRMLAFNLNSEHDVKVESRSGDAAGASSTADFAESFM
jgi:hypothetical protein